VTPHIDRASLLAYIDGDTSVDRLAIASHLAECAECRRALAEAQWLTLLLRDVVLHDLAHGDPDPGRDLGWRDILAEQRRLRDEEVRANTVYADLRRVPVEAWKAEIAQRSHDKTEGLVRRIIQAVEIELNRLPERALHMLDAAEEITNGLHDTVARRCLGDCWKHRANALRHLGRYPESLDAAELAETLYRSVQLDDFDVGQALFTRAGTLFKMTRYDSARAVLREATEVLRSFGASMPLAKTLILDGVIRCEQGDIAGAETVFLELVPMLEKFEDEMELARVRTNLAECTLRLGRPVDALPQAEAAVAGFARLAMDAEEIRARWTVAVIHLALGDGDVALDGLYDAAAAFEGRGMLGDAAFVKLDITEELLRRKEWSEAATNARELAVLFTKAGVTIASVLALAYLAEAVEGERAMPELVQYVRSYVTADDPDRRFEPPADGPR